MAESTSCCRNCLASSAVRGNACASFCSVLASIPAETANGTIGCACCASGALLASEVPLVTAAGTDAGVSAGTGTFSNAAYRSATLLTGAALVEAGLVGAVTLGVTAGAAGATGLLAGNGVIRSGSAVAACTAAVATPAVAATAAIFFALLAADDVLAALIADARFSGELLPATWVVASGLLTDGATGLLRAAVFLSCVFCACACARSRACFSRL